MKSLNFYQSVFRLFPFHLSLIIVLSILVAFVEMLSLVSVLPVLTILFEGKEATSSDWTAWLFEITGLSRGDLSAALFVLCAVFVLRELVQNLANMSIQLARASVEARLRADYVSSMLDIGYGAVRKHRPSTMVNVLTSQIDTVGVGVRLLGNLATNAIVGSIFVVSALYLQPILIFLLTPIAALSFLIARVSSKLSRRYARRNIKLRESVIRNVNASLSSFKSIKMYGMEDFYKNNIKDSILKYRLNLKRLFFVEFYSLTAPQIFSVVLIFGCLAYYFNNFESDYSDVLVVIMILYRAAGRIVTLQTAWRSLSQHIPAFENVQMSSSALKADRELINGRLQVPDEISEVRFNSLSLSYDNRVQVLDSVSVSLPVRGIVALVGPSGAGKTSFADVLAGLYPPSAGSVEINGVGISDFDFSEWRSKIAYIPQDSLLIPGSLMDNIRFGITHMIADERVYDVAQVCGIDEFVRRFPDGYETQVSELGAALSGGQRQRILIARALLSGRPILLIDEGTSALDVASEADLYEILKRHAVDHLVLLIAHRLEPLKSADQVVVFENGRIVQKGSYKELVGEEGLFQSMVHQWASDEVGELDE